MNSLKIPYSYSVSVTPVSTLSYSSSLGSNSAASFTVSSSAFGFLPKSALNKSHSSSVKADENTST